MTPKKKISNRKTLIRGRTARNKEAPESIKRAYLCSICSLDVRPSWLLLSVSLNSLVIWCISWVSNLCINFCSSFPLNGFN